MRHHAHSLVTPGHPFPRSRLTATATAAATGHQRRPATAHNSRTIHTNWAYVRPEKRTVAGAARMTQGYALAGGRGTGRTRSARQYDDDVGSAAVGHHGDRPRVGCGDLRPPHVVRPDTHRFLVRGGQLRVVLIERERVRGRLRGGVRADQRGRTRTTQRARASSLGPGGDRELTRPARRQLAVKGQGYLAAGCGNLETLGRDFRGWTSRSGGRTCCGGGRTGRR